MQLGLVFPKIDLLSQDKFVGSQTCKGRYRLSLLCMAHLISFVADIEDKDMLQRIIIDNEVWSLVCHKMCRFDIERLCQIEGPNLKVEPSILEKLLPVECCPLDPLLGKAL